MNISRLRMVAGPNGSGKSTLIEHFRASYTFPLGHLLNPDELDRQLQTVGQLNLRSWGIETSEPKLKEFLRNHPLGGEEMAATISFGDGAISIGVGFHPGYFAAVLSDFIRRQWLARGETFTFETVMSGRDKLDLLREACDQGYRTYLYYICTDNPLINRERVAARVAQGGHDVPEEKIGARYERSLSMLRTAIALCHRAYLFDNSGRSHRFFAEFNEGKIVATDQDMPLWFERVSAQQSR